MSDSFADELNKCTMLYLAVLKQTGIWDLDMAIFVFWDLQSVFFYKQQRTRINNEIYHPIKETPDLCHSKISSPRTSSRIQVPFSSLLCRPVCWIHLTAVSPYNCKMADVVIEAHQSTISPGNNKGDISD